MNSTVRAARLRLAALWFAITAHAFGEFSVRTFAIIRQSDGFQDHTVGFLLLVLGLSPVPAFALAPLIGSLASGRGRWLIMVLGTLFGLVAVALATYDDAHNERVIWYFYLIAMAIETAFIAASCFAILPEASRSAHLSLPQLNGLFVTAIVAAMYGGLRIGTEHFPETRHGMPIPLQVGLVGYGLALVFLMFARFRTERPTRFRDGLIVPLLMSAREILRTRRGRSSLIAMWGLFAMGLAVSQWMMPQTLEARCGFFLALFIGIVVGALHPDPFRTMGRIPFALTGLLAFAIWAAAAGNWHSPALGMAVCIGVTVVPLLTTYQIYQPDNTRGHGGALLFGGFAAITGIFLILLMQWLPNPSESRATFAWSILVLAIAGFVLGWTEFFRGAIEWLLELILLPMYRTRAYGPGVHVLPWRGPALIIANHAAWFDPLWLQICVPFPSTPMMTSRFFDLPVIGWYVRWVVGAIRVPDVHIRKDAPEIADVIAALDRNACVFVFPEGWLRRKDEQPMKRFGRGIWQIIKSRPNIPIYACWIEGAWGSYLSHRNGPPMKNKRIDIRRPIKIAFLEPFKVDPTVLETHMATRTFLMKKVIEARDLLGLPSIDVFKMQGGDDEAADKPQTATEGAS